MKIIFSPRALRGCGKSKPTFAYDNVSAAAKVVSRIRQSTEVLADYPMLGRDWHGQTRALIVSGLPYRIHDRADEGTDVLEIITVAHTSQKPPRFK